MGISFDNIGIEPTGSEQETEFALDKAMFSSYIKEDGFLAVNGWQGYHDFLYFDTGVNRYRRFASETVDYETIREMDKTNALAEYYEVHEEFPEYAEWAVFTGNKYYIFHRGSMDCGTPYTYENGEFVKAENPFVCKSNDGNLDTVYEYATNIDMGKAIEKMEKIQ